MHKEKMVVIGGGVGPEAGRLLHGKLIQETRTDGTDQDHLPVAHLSISELIMDRTAFLQMSPEQRAEAVAQRQDPAYGMYTVVEAAAAAASSLGKDSVAGVPCNTFHAPEIWDRFQELLRENGVEVQVLHMLNEAADHIRRILPDLTTVGVMSTTGTREVGIYNQILQPRGLTIVQVPDEVQPELHNSIYNKKWGIKAVSPVTERARDNFVGYASRLIDEGAEAIILGCTEIPLALPEAEIDGVALVDPMTALSRALIRETDPSKLKPLT